MINTVISEHGDIEAIVSCCNKPQMAFLGWYSKKLFLLIMPSAQDYGMIIHKRIIQIDINCNNEC